MEGMGVLEGGAAGSAKVGQMERDPKRQRGPGDDDRSNIQGMECNNIKPEINSTLERNNKLDMSIGDRKLDGGTFESGRNWMSSGDNTDRGHRRNDGTHARDDRTHVQIVGRSSVGLEGDGASERPEKSQEPQPAIQMQANHFHSSCMNANPTHQQGAIDRLKQQMGALESPVLLPIMQRAEPSPSTSLMNYGVSDAQRRGKMPDQGNMARGANPNGFGGDMSAIEMVPSSGDMIGGMYEGEAMHGHVQASAQAAANAGFYYPWAYNAQAYGLLSQQLQQQQQAEQQQHKQQPEELEDAGRRRKSSVAESDIEDAHQQRMDRTQMEDGKPRREMAANDDGYNWRKYGEKQVKGSKFPRSYYKCSHQGCPMKKIVERDPISGIISQSVIKGGHHTHPRPNAARTDATNSLLPQNGMVNSIRDDEAAGKRSKWRKSVDSEEHGTDSHKLDGTKLDRAESSDIIGDIQHSPQRDNQEHIERKEDMKEAAVMALQLLGTGFSPDVGALGPGMASTPASLIPLPPTLRASPLNVKQKQAKNHFNGRRHSLYTVYSSPMKESEIPKDMLDHGEVNSEDEWETCEADFGVEDDETVSAAIAAATAFVCKEFKQDAQDAMLRKQDARKASGPDALPLEDEPSPKKKSKKSSKKNSDGDKSDAQKNDEHKTVIQTETDSDQLEDGYRWRKYGQKVVKGNPHPRSYYKCTHQGCKVRKQVERSGDNVRVLITTYEGSHTHDPPPGGKTQQRRPSPVNRKPNTPTGQHLLGTSMSPTLQSYLNLANNGTFPLLLAPPSFMMGQGFQGLPLMSSPQQQQQASDQIAAMIASMNGDGAQASAPGDHIMSLQNAAQQRIQAQLAQAQAFQAALSRSPAALHALHMLQGQVQQDTEEKQGAHNT